MFNLFLNKIILYFANDCDIISTNLTDLLKYITLILNTTIISKNLKKDNKNERRTIYYPKNFSSTS